MSDVKKLKVRKVENIVRQQYGLSFFVINYLYTSSFKVDKELSEADYDNWEEIKQKGKYIQDVTDKYCLSILKLLCKDKHIKEGEYIFDD